MAFSATAAEIFIPESQLPVYREALQQFVIEVHPEAPAVAPMGSFSKTAIALPEKTLWGEDCAIETS